MSGNTRERGSMEQSRGSHMSFACPAVKAGSATPTKSCSIVETIVTTLVSFFVLVATLLVHLVRLVLVRCLTGLVKLNSLVGLTTPRACTAVQGV